MSKPFWTDVLTQTLIRLQKPDRPARVAIVGIGHELRGDDAAGLIIARTLQPLVASPASARLLVIEAGPAPENYTGPLRRFKPDLVLLVDAAQIDEPPGSVCWLDWRATTGLDASTHTLPPYVLARYLTAELGCEVALLGIQPLNLAIKAPLSSVVKQAIDMIGQTLAEVLIG